MLCALSPHKGQSCQKHLCRHTHSTYTIVYTRHWFMDFPFCTVCRSCAGRFVCSYCKCLALSSLWTQPPSMSAWPPCCPTSWGRTYRKTRMASAYLEKHAHAVAMGWLQPLIELHPCPCTKGCYGYSVHIGITHSFCLGGVKIHFCIQWNLSIVTLYKTCHGFTYLG